MPIVEFPFPLLGVNEGQRLEDQPPQTSGYMLNVRPYDVLENRVRGGQRPGLAKRFNEQIGGASSPVVAMCEVVIVE